MQIRDFQNGSALKCDALHCGGLFTGSYIFCLFMFFREHHYKTQIKKMLHRKRGAFYRKQGVIPCEKFFTFSALFQVLMLS